MQSSLQLPVVMNSPYWEMKYTFLFAQLLCLIRRSQQACTLHMISFFSSNVHCYGLTRQIFTNFMEKYLKFFADVRKRVEVNKNHSPAGRLIRLFDPSSSVSNGWNRLAFVVHANKTMTKSIEIDFMNENIGNRCESFAIFNLYLFFFVTRNCWESMFRLKLENGFFFFFLWIYCLVCNLLRSKNKIPIVFTFPRELMNWSLQF